MAGPNRSSKRTVQGVEDLLGRIDAGAAPDPVDAPTIMSPVDGEVTERPIVRNPTPTELHRADRAADDLMDLMSVEDPGGLYEYGVKTDQPSIQRFDELLGHPEFAQRFYAVVDRVVQPMDLASEVSLADRLRDLQGVVGAGFHHAQQAVQELTDRTWHGQLPEAAHLEDPFPVAAPEPSPRHTAGRSMMSVDEPSGFMKTLTNVVSRVVMSFQSLLRSGEARHVEVTEVSPPSESGRHKLETAELTWGETHGRQPRTPVPHPGFTVFDTVLKRDPSVLDAVVDAYAKAPVRANGEAKHPEVVDASTFTKRAYFLDDLNTALKADPDLAKRVQGVVNSAIDDARGPGFKQAVDRLANPKNGEFGEIAMAATAEQRLSPELTQGLDRSLELGSN